MRNSWISFFLFLTIGAAEPADLVIRAARVVTMDAGGRIVEDGAVAVRGGRIAALGPRADIDRLAEVLGAAVAAERRALVAAGNGGGGR